MDKELLEQFQMLFSAIGEVKEEVRDVENRLKSEK